MSEKKNPYAAPKAAVLETPPPQNCWREGKVLVMRVGSGLPARCVKCNEPAIRPMKEKQMWWHHPGWYLLILINILFYAVVALIVRKKAKVALGICEDHEQRRRAMRNVAWVFFAGSLGLMFGGIHLEKTALIIVGTFGLLAAVIVGIMSSRSAYPVRITKEEIRLKGCGAPFLDSLESR